jgi:hypothetical protein
MLPEVAKRGGEPLSTPTCSLREEEKKEHNEHAASVET